MKPSIKAQITRNTNWIKELVVKRTRLLAEVAECNRQIRSCQSEINQLKEIDE